MPSPLIDDDTIIAFVANPAGHNNYHVYFGMGPEKGPAVDAIYQYIIKGFENNQEHPVGLWEVLLVVVENIKKDFPNIAAEVRRQNIEHIKNKKGFTNENEG